MTAGLGPSDIWVLLDEHPDSINDAVFGSVMASSDPATWNLVRCARQGPQQCLCVRIRRWTLGNASLAVPDTDSRRQLSRHPGRKQPQHPIGPGCRLGLPAYYHTRSQRSFLGLRYALQILCLPSKTAPLGDTITRWFCWRPLGWSRPLCIGTDWSLGVASVICRMLRSRGLPARACGLRSEVPPAFLS